MLALFSEIIVGKLNLTEHLFLETTFTRTRQGRKCESGSRNCKVKPYFLKRAEMLFALESMDLLIWLVREPLGLGEKIEIQSLESQLFFVCVLKSKMDYESKEYTLQRNSSVDRLGKLPLKEQQLSRTQHFILNSHAAMFVLHTQYGPCGIPLTPMIRQHNYLLSTSPLSKKTINMLICFAGKISHQHK